MLTFFRRPYKIACLVLVTVGSVLSAAAQQHGSIPVTGGSGSVSYLYTATLRTCYQKSNPKVTHSYYTYYYNSFSYVASNGTIMPYPSYVTVNVQGMTNPPVESTCPKRSVSGRGATLFEGGYGSAYAVAVAIASSSSLGFTATYYTGTSGYINPKYMVVGVIYSPPGSLSTVSYANSSLTSSTTSVMASLTNSSTTTSSSQVGGTFLFGYLEGTQKTTQSSTVTQQNQGTTAVTVTYTKSKSLTVAGPGPVPTGDYQGVNHDLDRIEVWLNPVLLFTEFTINGTNSFIWYGYGFSELDTVAPVHIVEVEVGCLNGDYAATSGCKSELALLQRPWAANENWPTGQGPGLTSTDLSNILKADPFGQCRFTTAIGSSTCPVPAPGFILLPPQYTVTPYSFQYNQAVPGEQPAPVTFTYSMTNATTTSQQGTTTVAQTYGFESSLKGTKYLSDFQQTVGSSQTLTYAYQQNSQITISSTSTAAANIQQPGPACVGSPCNPNYPPSSATYGTAIYFDIYQDNYFGTFLFVPTQY